MATTKTCCFSKNHSQSPAYSFQIHKQSELDLLSFGKPTGFQGSFLCVRVTQGC